MTRTRSFTGYAEIVTQFINDFKLPDPRSVFIHGAAGVVTVLIDGEGEVANLISESLYWETNDLGITSAHVVFDGVPIDVVVYES